MEWFILVRELVIGLAADVPYFLIIASPPPQIDKYLFQWVVSVLRITLYSSFAWYFPLEAVSFPHADKVTITTVILIEILLNGVFSFVGSGKSWKQLSSKVSPNSWMRRATPSQIILLLFLFPLTEELFFRWFLFQRWKMLVGLFPALLLQSAWFLANHSPFLWVRAFRSISYALSFYFSGGSLFASWLCHVANNCIALRFDSQSTFQ